MKNKKMTNIITLIIIPLVVTALWEKILGPLFDISITWLSTFGSAFLQASTDLIYIYIATGRPIDISKYLFMIIISYMLGGLLTTTSESIKSRKKAVALQNKLINPTDSGQMVSVKKELTESEEINHLAHNAKKYSRIFIAFTICGYTAYVLFISVTGYINSTIAKLTNNIEIVAPYIDDYEYKLLKSTFYSMEGADDYHSLVTELNRIAETNGIKLKD